MIAQSFLKNWSALTDRERNMLQLLAIFIMGLVLFYGLMVPVQDYRRDALLDLDGARADHAYMTSLIREVKDLNEHTSQLPQTVLNEATLRRTMSQTARQAGITIVRVQPDDSGRLSVWTAAAPSPAFFNWLKQLKQETSLQVQTALLQQSSTAGQIEAQITLDRAASQ